MSIEVDLNRIATSLEEIVKHLKSTPVSLGNPGKTEAAPKAQAVKKETKASVPPVVAEVVDPITGVGPVAAISQDELHAHLQAFMEKNGVEAVKVIMIKHGASKVKPTITSIPPANYAALVAELGK